MRSSRRTVAALLAGGVLGVTAVTLGLSGAVADGAPGSDLPAEKQAIVDHMNEPRIRDKSTVPPGPRPVSSADLANSRWPSGLFEDTEAPASGSVFLGRNRWVGDVNGHQVAVHAGQAGFDAANGRLLVLVSAADGSVTDSKWIDAPGVGALHIEAASGTVLRLSSASGRTLRYDVLTGVLS